MFDLIAPTGPAGPVIVSVPHAGRTYSPDMIAMLRVPAERLVALEDRHVDVLADHAPAAGAALVVARVPRAWIDLNRGEDDVDQGMIDPPHFGGRAPSLKVRGGLGLVPRRLAGVGDLWRQPLARAALDDRIAAIHRPYHAALTGLVADRQACFGTAILIDLHSMPPLTGTGWDRRPQIVIGDRFGQSAGHRFTARLRFACEAAGFVVAENTPYPGGHLIERHGAPGRGIHAVQIEIDRSLYLRPGLFDPDPMGVARMRGLITALIEAVADEARGPRLPIAAE